jgi:hypothetical protein
MLAFDGCDDDNPFLFYETTESVIKMITLLLLVATAISTVAFRFKQRLVLTERGVQESLGGKDF